EGDPALGIPLAIAALGPGAPPRGDAAGGWLRLPDCRVAVRGQRPPHRVCRESPARARRLNQDFFAAFARLTLFACLPMAVRVFFGRCAIVRFFLAAAAAFLMFLRAAARCLSLAMA